MLKIAELYGDLMYILVIVNHHLTFAKNSRVLFGDIMYIYAMVIIITLLMLKTAEYCMVT